MFISFKVKDNIHKKRRRWAMSRFCFVGCYTPLIPTTSISNDKQRRNVSDLDMVTYPFMDGDIPRSTSNGVYIS